MAHSLTPFEFASRHCLKEIYAVHTTPSSQFANYLCLEILMVSPRFSYHFPIALTSFYCGSDTY